jgi:Domain of unknown function (DUF4062)
MKKVFLSSTCKDLEKHRNAAHRAIEGLDECHCVGMEDFGSVGGAPDEICRAKIKKCDLFICIVGPSYGSRSPTGASFTELEYNAALASIGKKRCLIFKTSDDFLLAANLVESDEDRNRQKAFRDRVSSEFIVSHFSTEDQVARLVTQAIRNYEFGKARKPIPTQENVLASQVSSVSYRVGVRNESTIVSDDEVIRVVAAFQKQISKHFKPVWGVDAELFFFGKHAEAPSHLLFLWSFVIEDESRKPGLLSVQKLTAEGLPEVRVAVQAAKAQHGTWTIMASRCLLEMLVDPYINQTIFVSAGGRKGRLYAREICAPVASAELSFLVDGVAVSNFVYPAWFEAFREPRSTQFDHRRHLTAPFEVAQDCQVNLCEVTISSGWKYLLEQGSKPVSKSRTTKKTKTRLAAIMREA